MADVMDEGESVPHDAIDAFLEEYAQRFEQGQSDIDFFELVRFLDLMNHKPSFGFAHNTNEESLRSSQNLSLSYAETAINQFKPHGTKLEDYLEALARKNPDAYALLNLEPVRSPLLQSTKPPADKPTADPNADATAAIEDTVKATATIEAGTNATADQSAKNTATLESGGESLAAKSNEALSAALAPSEQERLQQLAVLLARPTLITNFFGLFGPNGPMPLAMSEYFYKRVHNANDKAGSAFLNIINHKFLGLFYRAYFCQQQALGADRSSYDFTSKILLSMLGCDFQMLSRNIDAQLSLSLARFLSQNIRSASMLETALQEFFALPIHVREYQTERYQIPPMYRAQILRESTIRRYQCPERALFLGQNVQIGEHYLSRTKKFTIEVAQVTFAQCEPLLPGRWGFYLLGRIVSLFLQRPLDFDLVFKMTSVSIPAACLNSPKTVLGVCAYLPSRRKSVETLRIGASHLMEEEHASSI